MPASAPPTASPSSATPPQTHADEIEKVAVWAEAVAAAAGVAMQLKAPLLGEVISRRRPGSSLRAVRWPPAFAGERDRLIRGGIWNKDGEETRYEDPDRPCRGASDRLDLARPARPWRAADRRPEAQARARVAKTELPGIAVTLSREPLARVATLRGSANDLQREGLGSQKGLSDYVRDVDGISSVRWADEPDAGAQGRSAARSRLSALAALAYLIGLGLGWLLWGRRRREGFA